MRDEVYDGADVAPSLKFNSKAALRFCELIDPEADAFDFRSIGPDWLSRKDPKYASIKHSLRSLRGQFLRRWLKSANRDIGRGVFMTINETDGRGVKSQNIIRVRAVFADLDNGLPGEWPLEPSFVVNSSPGKYQAYWLVKDEMTSEQFASVMRGIGEHWGSAKEAKDIARVLRVPGFWHQKRRDRPHRVRFHSKPEGEPVRYKAALLMEVFGVEAKPKPKPEKVRRRADDITAWTDADIESMLDAIPVDRWDSRDGWLKIGMALHHFYSGGQTGYSLWCQYARQSEKFDPTDSERTWKGFSPGNVTLGTVVHMAKENGWKPERRDDDAATERQRAKYEKDAKATKASKGKKPKQSSSRLVATALSEYRSQHIEWLWRYRIPKNMISLLAGFGDVGKSTLLYDVAARISVGGKWPNGEGQAPKGNVLLFNREDTPQHIIRPRIIAARGDPNAIHYVNGLRDDEGNLRPFNIDTDIAELDRLVKEIGNVQLVVFDPLSSYFGGKTNTWRESQVRAVLEPLAEKVNEWECALIGNTHLGKTEHEGNANLRILNSVAIVNLARIINMVQKDPEDGEIRIFGQTKRNIAKAKSSLRFGFDTKLVDTSRVEAAKLVWQGEADVSVEDMMANGKGKVGPRDMMRQWLKGYLSHEAQTWEAIVKAGEAEGYTERTLRRVRDAMQSDGSIVKCKEPGKLDGEWLWAVPAPKQPKAGS